jgi:hypothetical protein
MAIVLPMKAEWEKREANVLITQIIESLVYERVQGNMCQQATCSMGHP